MTEKTNLVYYGRKRPGWLDMAQGLKTTMRQHKRSDLQPHPLPDPSEEPGRGCVGITAIPPRVDHLERVVKSRGIHIRA